VSVDGLQAISHDLRGRGFIQDGMTTTSPGPGRRDTGRYLGLVCSALAALAGCGSGGEAGAGPAVATSAGAGGMPAAVGQPHAEPGGADDGPSGSAGGPGSVEPGLGADAYVPLYGPDTKLSEQIQYTEADGTLVTVMGMRPTERHARERGEDWDAPDAGPGRYLTFPSFYFQNRSYGLEIHDHMTADPPRQSIEIYLVVNDGTFDGTTFSLFRNSHDEGVTGYGWSLNTGFNNPTLDGKSICPAGKKADCKVSFDSYWDVGKGEPHRALQLGDVIELAPAERLERYGDGMHEGEAVPDGMQGKAVVDGGGSRYYSFEQTYVVGQGLRPWYGVAPRLMNAPLPDDTLLGGLTSLSYNYSEEPMRVFQQMANNIGAQNAKRFLAGRREFHTSYLTGKHSEHENDNPVFEQHQGQLGPRFNQERCIACHTSDGRSPVPALGAPLDAMAVITAAASDEHGMTPDPTYGFNVQQHAQERGAADFSVSIAAYQTTERTLPDGEVIELRTPSYAFAGGTPAQFSVRQAPQVIGLGLLEALAETTILALADPADEDGDGVRGIPNWVKDPETGQLHLGRFGWKASKATLRQQASDAALKDMGVTSVLFPSRSCQQGAPDCRTTGETPSLVEEDVQVLTDYLSLLAVPAQRSLRSGFPEGIRVSPEHDVDPELIARGGQLFAEVDCTSCHVASLRTGSTHPFAELRDQLIHPYTDLLLHDMGAGLSDSITEGQATPSRWRTSPLWGIGSLKYVQDGEENVRYLHDGRARTLLEAIGWHAGEAEHSRAEFEALDAADRAAIFAFLGSL
jgi:CxxC motif-containing protein (DUF1111 family)